MASQLGAELNTKWFHRLTHKNDYDARDCIFDNTAQILTNPTLESLIDNWCQRYTQSAQSDPYDDKALSLQVQIEKVAKSAGNITLYAKLSMEGRMPDQAPQAPQAALEVAELYLQQEYPEEALATLPKRSHRSWASETSQLLIHIQEAWGNTSEAIATRLTVFKESPSKKAAVDYLAQLSEEQRADAQAQLRKIVEQGSYDWHNQTRYYIDCGDFAVAAQLIEADPQAASEANYYTQSDFAKALGKAHARATSILLRGAVKQTLTAAKPKNYPHAVRYIKQLIDLAIGIKTWDKLETHDDWFARLIQRHTLKSTFIQNLEAARIL